MPAELSPTAPGPGWRGGFLAPFRRTGLLVVASAVMVIAVVVLGRVLAGATGWSRNELTIDQFLSRHHVPVLDAVALGIGWVLSPLHGLVLLLIVCALVWWRVRDRLVAATFAVTVFGGWLSSELVKIIAHRARPDFHALAHPLSFEVNFASFPSGHTCLITALMLGFVFLLRGRSAQRPMLVAATLVVLLVAVSRLYIGAHYPTDVLGSMVYTSAAMTGFLAVWNRWFAVPAGTLLHSATTGSAHSDLPVLPKQSPGRAAAAEGQTTFPPSDSAHGRGGSS